MAELEQLQSDLAFIRDVVHRSEKPRSPAAIPLLWAAVVLVGFTLADFAPARVPLYWVVAAPLGTIASSLIGWRKSRRGRADRELGLRRALHWIATVAVIFLAALQPASGRSSWSGVSAVALLILALSYFQAGLHLERRMIWLGLLLAAGYVAVLFVRSYAWTILGVVLAAALVAGAVVRGGERDVPGPA